MCLRVWEFVSPGALSELVHRLTHSVIRWLAIPQGRLDLFVPHQLHDLSRVCHLTEPGSEAVPQAVPDVILVKARLLADLLKVRTADPCLSSRVRTALLRV